MPIFVLNSKRLRNGEHEVHSLAETCPHLPRIENQIDLGRHPTCNEALELARRLWPNYRINGCPHCAKDCHID
jgi:hypothetical protein